MPSLQQGNARWRPSRKEVRRPVKLQCPHLPSTAPLASLYLVMGADALHELVFLARDLEPEVFADLFQIPALNIGADVWGESNIMTGVYERWCSSTLHIGWGLCDRRCLVFV
jgi:hypothetical protein